MKTPLVSVIIPTYNRLEKLKVAIESVVQQSFQNFEIIVVDDGSTDGTKDFFKTDTIDTRINYHFKENEGLPSLSRNYGAEKAKGKYLAFLDSDDLWLSSKLQVQIDFLEDNPEYIFSYTQAKTTQGKKISGLSLKKTGAIESSLLFRNFIVTSSVCVLADYFDSVEGFPIAGDIVVAEDYSLWIKLSRKGLGKYFPEPLVIYELGGGISSENLLRNLSCYYLVMIDALNKSRCSPLYKELVIFMYWLRRINISRLDNAVLADTLEKIKTLESNYISQFILRIFVTLRTSQK